MAKNARKVVRVLCQTCQPLISLPVVPVGRLLAASVSPRVTAARRASASSIAGGERQRDEHNHVLGQP